MFNRNTTFSGEEEMDASSFITSLQTTPGVSPKIAGAIGILVIGWLIAVVCGPARCACSAR